LITGIWYFLNNPSRVIIVYFSIFARAMSILSKGPFEPSAACSSHERGQQYIYQPVMPKALEISSGSASKSGEILIVTFRRTYTGQTRQAGIIVIVNNLIFSAYSLLSVCIDRYDMIFFLRLIRQQFSTSPEI